MASVNKAIILGRLGKDPELRVTNSGMSICKISLATSRKKKDGEQETEWHNVVFMDKLADVVGKYCAKGKEIYVEGRLRTSKWQDKDGQDRYTREIVAESMQLLGGNDEQSAPQRPAPRPVPSQRPAPAKSGTGFDDMDDDIPF